MLKTWSFSSLLTHYNTQAPYTNLDEFITQEDDDSLFRSPSCSTCSLLETEEYVTFIFAPNTAMSRSRTSNHSDDAYIPSSPTMVDDTVMSTNCHIDAQDISLPSLGCVSPRSVG